MSVVAFTLIYFLFGKYNYELYIIFYLLVGEDLNPVTEGSARVNVKERKKKERQDRRAKKIKRSRQKAKSPSATQAIGALIGNEEQKEK